MKKISYFVLTLALLLGAVSCTDALDPRSESQVWDQQIPDDAKITIYFGSPDKVVTKADMAAQPDIKTMHVFVFNKIGLLLETAQAKQLGLVTQNGEAGAKHWAVDLQMGAAERHLHFIADLPEDFEIPTTGTEVSLIQSITTKAPAAAYWQRIVLEHGINAYKYDGSGTYSFVNPTTGEKITVAVPGTVSGETYSYQEAEGDETITITVNKGDYINTSGKKVLDAKGLYASAELSEKVALVPMIRNFACIKVTSSMAGFIINQAALINTPKEGFVAPYNEIKNEFVYSYSHPDPSQPFTTFDIDTSGYPATIPVAGINIPTIGTDNKLVGVTYKQPVTVSGKDSVTFFMNERSVPTSDPTSLLIQGTRNNVTKWYKIEITNEDGGYFPIYRAFTYVVDIKGLSADGYDTPEEAFNNSPVGDLSASVETSTLNQISDGKGLTMWVEYIDYTDMDANPNEHAVTLLYKLYYTSTGTTPVTTNITNLVTPTIKPYANTDAAIIGFTTAAYTGTDTSTPDGKGGWYQATITLDGVGENIKKSDLHVSAELSSTQNPGGYAKKISRDVTYRVLPKQPLTVTASELANESANEPTTVTITLPANLGYSVFPLTLMIEAGNNGLMTTEGLAVETGKTITGGTGNTFYYLKTINYSDYENSRTYTCNFKTTRSGTATNSNATTIYVKDKEGRFDLASCELSVIVIGVTPVEQIVNGSASSATFNIVSNLDNISNFSWDISDVSSGATFSSYSGNSPQTISMYFDPITDPESSGKTYTATLTYSYNDASNQSQSKSVLLKVNQSSLKLVTKTETISTTFRLADLANSTSTSVTDSDGAGVKLTLSDGITYNNGGYLTTNGTLLFEPIKGERIKSNAIKEIALAWTNNNYRPASIELLSETTNIGNNTPSWSWNGESEDPLEVTVTRRTGGGANNFRINSISISYKYTIEEYQ